MVVLPVTARKPCYKQTSGKFTLPNQQRQTIPQNLAIAGLLGEDVIGYPVSMVGTTRNVNS
jgi:hypothetical protein